MSGNPAPANPALPNAAPANTGPCCTIAAGTPILLEVTSTLSSHDQKRGDKFGLKLLEPVFVGGTTVLPPGVEGVGEVIDAGAPGVGGAPGKLLLAGRYLTWNGQQIPLRGLKVGGSGQSHVALSAGVGVAVGVFGLLVHGGNMVVPAGTQVNAKIAVATWLPPAPVQSDPGPHVLSGAIAQDPVTGNAAESALIAPVTPVAQSAPAIRTAPAGGGASSTAPHPAAATPASPTSSNPANTTHQE